jgi:hypothetical protein
MYMAYARRKGTTEEFKPVTWCGEMCYGVEMQGLLDMVGQMQQFYPEIEYKVEEVTP